MPLTEDMLLKQFRQRIFTVIDRKHGYHQMPLAEESRACTALSTPKSTPLGPLQWKVMPMGVTGGNAAFERMLMNLLEPVRDRFVDGVIIASGDLRMSYDELLEAHERDVTRRAYLGFCNYYSGHINMYAKYAAPVMALLKGNREETRKGYEKALCCTLGWNDESD